MRKLGYEGRHALGLRKTQPSKAAKARMAAPFATSLRAAVIDLARGNDREPPTSSSFSLLVATAALWLRP
jgi:hypothetical protein